MEVCCSFFLLVFWSDSHVQTSWIKITDVKTRASQLRLKWLLFILDGVLLIPIIKTLSV